jgi:hypothetical protein
MNSRDAVRLQGGIAPGPQGSGNYPTGMQREAAERALQGTYASGRTAVRQALTRNKFDAAGNRVRQMMARTLRQRAQQQANPTPIQAAGLNTLPK